MALGEVHHLIQISGGDASRPSHDMNSVLMALRGDKPHLCPSTLNESIGTDSRSVGQNGNLLAEIAEL